MTAQPAGPSRMETLRQGGWSWPDGWRPTYQLATCREPKCRASILWCLTPRGKLAPVGRDGAPHFATCPGADRFRRRP